MPQYNRFVEQTISKTIPIEMLLCNVEVVHVHVCTCSIGGGEQNGERGERE